ncbi:MAG TPA: glycosyltransferase, partial [Cryobacterium sp.]|nr:glycosyltransferase [Cryobacterium sp.]
SPEMALPLVVGPRRKPVVTHIHGAANPLSVSRYPWARASLLRRVFRGLQRFGVARSTLVLSVDDAGLRLAAGGGGRGPRTALLPVCVDTDLFARGDAAPARAALGLPSSARVLVFVGRLEAAKGTGRLVDAFADLVRQNESVVLVLIGDGSQRSLMTEQARRLGVLDRVVFAGWVDHDTLPRWFQAADVLLLPSDDEGLPTVVIEALSCGVPVVVTAVGGLPTLITDGENGILLRGRTAGELASATSEALHRDWAEEKLTASVTAYSAGSVAATVGVLLSQAAAAGHG